MSAVVLLGLFVLYFLISPVFRRTVTMGMADVYDFTHLPVNTIESSTGEFSFLTAPSNLNLDNYIYQRKAVGDFEELLQQNHTTAFLVVRNDTILYENYFQGHHRDSVCKVFSITKNVLSTLVGIAIDRKYIHSIDDPVKRYIPELDKPGFRDLTINHCLNGTAGIRYVKNFLPWGDEALMYYSQDVRDLLLHIKLAHPPGSTFSTENYSPLILGWLLERATDMTLTAFLQSCLWEPLGMNHHGYFVVDSEKNRFEKAESGLVIRPIDLLKFGRLWLNEGQWEGQQLISKEWVEKSIHPGSEHPLGILWESDEQVEYYSNMWWGFYENGGLDRYAANGHFGQRLYVVPDKNILVLRLGSDGGDIKWGAFISGLVSSLDSFNTP